MSLYDIAHEDLAAFAQMLSLPTSSMEPTYQPDTVRPSGSWLAAQAMLVDQLPEGLLWRNSPRKWALRASQIAKKVAMGMSGAGEALAAAAAAQEGVHMEAHQQSRKAPTVLCPAHEKLNPILVRQMFHYLTREAADCADPVRRHARHRQKKPSHSHRHHHRRLDDGGEACRSRVLRDWGNRLLGLCALWCDQETFAELEQGTLGCRRSRRRFGRTPRSRGVAVRRLQYRQRMPHLALPCEVCVLAAVAAQSSALIDLHASMLSRLALEDYGWEREARKGRHVDTAATQQNPHLWAVVQAWIDAFGPDEAAEIRRRGEALARDLFLVRRCEWQRRRRLDQEMHGRHHRHIHPRYHTGGDCNDHSCPARMATKYGHRLPLPFLALGEDSWPLADKMGEEEVMEELGGRQPSQGPVLATTRAPQMTYCTSKPLPVLSPDEQEQVLTQLMDEMLAEQRRQGPAATAAVDDSVEVGGKEWLHDWDEAYRQDMYETFMPMAGVPEDQDSYYENTTYEAVPPQARPEHKSRRPAAPAQASSSAYSHRTSTSKEPRLDRATREAAGAARSKRAPEKARREMRAPPAKESRSSATPATRHSTRPSRTTHSTHSATPATSSRSHDGTSTVTPDDSISRVAERKRREEDRKRREEERHVREEERLQREKRRREREERRAREEREEREERQARQARQSKGKGKEPERRSRTVETTRPSSSRHGTHGSRPSHHPRASTDETKRSSGRQ